MTNGHAEDANIGLPASQRSRSSRFGHTFKDPDAFAEQLTNL